MSQEYIPVPPGLVDQVARNVYETICEVAEVKVSDNRGTSWDSVGDEVRETWRIAARQAIATTLTTMHREGWLTKRPGTPASDAG